MENDFKKVYLNLTEGKINIPEQHLEEPLLRIVEQFFNFDAYLELMSNIINHSDYPNSAYLKTLRSDLFDIANKVYFFKFYREVSLEDKVRAEGFSFDVSIFKPLKRSVLFN